jgi:hypothetical protein
MQPIAVAYGAKDAVVSGRLNRPEDGVPSGDVLISLPDAQPIHTTLDDHGCFQATADTSALPVGTYTVTCEYPGDAEFDSNVENVKLVVNPVFLLVRANDFERLYGDPNPEFTGTIMDLRNADTVDVSYSCKATPAAPVGTYSIVPNLSDPDGRLRSYMVLASNGQLTVRKATLTVTAANFSRKVGQYNPDFSGNIDGLVNNDNITATYQCAATPQSPASKYQIVPTLVDPDGRLGNYDVTLSNGVLTVEAVAAAGAYLPGKSSVSSSIGSSTKPGTDTPRIEGTILDDNDRPFPGADVVIYDSSASTIVGHAQTNAQGKFTWVAPAKGTYYVGPKGDSSRKAQVVVRSAGTITMRFPSPPRMLPPAPPAAGRLPREISRDFAAFPVLTEEVGYPPSPIARLGGGAAGAAPGAVQLGDIAAKAVGDVLGWKVNADDPKAFVGALTQAFTLTEVEGHVESKWVPRSYIVQTDLAGGITGAQASLLSRAKDAVDQSLPLLDGLYALDPNADPEYVKALRELTRSQMNEIVKQLAEIGGPSVLRVDTYFKILLWGPAPLPQPIPVPTDADLLNPQSTLGSLRDEAGIQFAGNPFSNSVEDEQDITNFRVIVDYMISLWQSWINNRQYFLLGGNLPAFFGTQLVLISRQFSVIVETVNEVRFVLDSVFIGPSERQTALLHFTDPTTPPMFLEDVLQEIVDLATDEGPRLIRDGGRLSVNNNLRPVVETLLNMVNQIPLQLTNLGDLPDGLQTTRVENAFDDLHDQLTTLLNLTQQVGRDLPPPAHGLLVLPPNVDFGQIPVTGASSTPQAISVANNSSQTFPTVTVAVTPTPGAFQLFGNTLVGPLGPNAAGAVFVVFSPNQAGPQQGTLTVTAGGQTTVVTLTGIGV